MISKMSLQERVFGLETEYAINFYPVDQKKIPNQRLLVQTLQEILCREHGLPDSEYLVSGGKFHYDVGHAEWAGPECLTAREAAIYDKAADHLLAQIVPQAEHLLAIRGYEGRLLVVKNNVDSTGNTYGCHENYLMLRSTELLTYEHFLRYIIHSLIPFLVTRQVFAGAGLVVPAESTGRDTSPAHFEISQRAAFIDTTVSFDTTRERPILNLGRESEALAGGNSRRLHLILGDANLSGWATWLKLGTTGIVLRMIEDLFIGDVPLLLDPVAATHSIARDLSAREPLPLRQRGKAISALDVQWHYYALADGYLDQFSASPEEEQIMEAWEQALTDIEQDVMRLRNRADWVIKKHMLDSYLNQQGATWESLADSVLETLRTRDLLYHDLSCSGLFEHFFHPDTLVTAAEIEHAQRNPPQYTRARIRGEAIKQARNFKQRVTVDHWQYIVIGGKKIALPDPLAFDCAQLDFDEHWWSNSIEHVDRSISLRALRRLAWQPQAGALALLIQHAEHNSDVQMRQVAIEALGYRADKQAQNVLISYLNDSDSQVCWAAEEALEKVMRGVPTPDPTAIVQTEEEKPLIRIIS
jgi:proteasome accessory factor A